MASKRIGGKKGKIGRSATSGKISAKSSGNSKNKKLVRFGVTQSAPTKGSVSRVEIRKAIRSAKIA